MSANNSCDGLNSSIKYIIAMCQILDMGPVYVRRVDNF